MAVAYQAVDPKDHEDSSRAALFLLVLVPVNLAIVSHMTGLRLRTLLPAVPGPVLSEVAAIAVAVGLRAAGAGELPPFLALVVVGGGAAVTAAAVLLALEPDLRARLVALARSIRGRQSEPVLEEALLDRLEPVDPSAEPFDQVPAVVTRR